MTLKEARKKAKAIRSNLAEDNNEDWKQIDGHGGLYQISSFGRVKTNVHGKDKLMKRGFNGRYFQVTLSHGNRSMYSIHRLVATKFVDNPNNKPIVNHKDGNKLNNYYKNLRWSTWSENIQHAYDNKLRSKKIGEEHQLTTLTESQVIEIREIWKLTKKSQKEIAKIYNIDQGTVSNIVNYKTWSHV